MKLLDTEIRQALRKHLVARVRDSVDTVLVDELGIREGRARVDLALVNGELHGFEIKSEGDSLRRLGEQIELYSQVLDRCTLVLVDAHLDGAIAAAPSWWGVLRAVPGRSSVNFRRIRRAGRNPSVSARAVAELLWSGDAMTLLENRDAARGMKGKPRIQVWDRVCELYAVDEIRAEVRRVLKARQALRVDPPRA